MENVLDLNHNVKLCQIIKVVFRIQERQTNHFTSADRHLIYINRKKISCLNNLLSYACAGTFQWNQMQMTSAQTQMLSRNCQHNMWKLCVLNDWHTNTSVKAISKKLSNPKGNNSFSFTSKSIILEQVWAYDFTKLSMLKHSKPAYKVCGYKVKAIHLLSKAAAWYVS